MLVGGWVTVWSGITRVTDQQGFFPRALTLIMARRVRDGRRRLAWHCFNRGFKKTLFQPLATLYRIALPPLSQSWSGLGASIFIFVVNQKAAVTDTIIEKTEKTEFGKDSCQLLLFKRD